MKQQKILVLSIIILAVALIVFAAACTDIQDTSTITYMADGKEYASVALSGDETPSAPADPDKTGYIFAGWFTDETFEIPFDLEEYAANPDRTDIIVYAKFEIISTSVTYMVDDAEYKVLTVEGVNAEAPNYVPEKAGYKFVGWFTDDTLETPFDFEEYAADEGRTNITVYAKFEIISTTITYMTDDIKYQSFTVEGINAADPNYAPEKVGYIFAGWFTDETFETPFIFAEYAADEDRSNITVYAKFEIISTTVTYVADGAEYKVFTVEGVNAEDPNYVPEKTGYTFEGWFTDETFATPFDFEKYAADEGRTNITVYAKFEKIFSTTVTYMADGKKYKVFTVIGVNVEDPNYAPEKAGYTFEGWFEDETFETPFDFEAYAATLDRTDIIVYAKFEGYLSYEKNDDGGYTVTGLTVKTLPIADVVIPDTYNGLPVTAIGDMAFELNPIITSVTLGKNVTEIGAGAFDRCELLQTAALNEGLKTIGNNAFSNCALTEIPALPASLTTLGNYVFAYNEYVTSLTIPDHVTTIGHGIVASCHLLESLNVPSQWYSADDPTKLITYFTGYFFGNTETPSNQVIIFAQYYPNFENITVRGDMEELPSYAFYQVESLKHITFTGTFTKIGDNAFANCYALESLVLPDVVTEVGETIFAGCESLKELSMPLAGNMTLESLFGNIKPPLESVRIYTSGKITAMFKNCYSLKKIVIEGNVTEIGKEAFYGSRVLTDLTLPASVTHIEDIFIYFFNFQSDFKVTYEGTMAQWHEITLESADLDSPIPVICTDGTTTWNKPQAQASEIAL